MTDKTDILLIGAGLTGLTTAYYLKRYGHSVILLEKSDRTGGNIQSFSEKDFVFESGPTSGVVSSVELADLLEDLSSQLTVKYASEEAHKRWIWKGKGWKSLPNVPISAVCTPLFTWKDKFRILGEPFRKAGTDPDESVSDMVVRRLGRSFLDYAVDPFVSGVYAGNPDELTVRHALPKLYRLEQTYGSFVRGSLIRSCKPKPEAERKVSRRIFSFEGGLQQLTETLTQAAGSDSLHTSCQNIEVLPLNPGFQTCWTDRNGQRHRIESNQVVCTLGSKGLYEVLPFVGEQNRRILSTMPYSGVGQVAVGYRHWKGIPLDAFGGLVPSKENRNCLGILFPSSLFTDRAPSGGALLSVFVGGARHPEWMDYSPEKIQALALNEIASTLGCREKPDLIRVFKHQQAIPQYGRESQQRLQAVESVQQAFPGLILAGNIRDGIGISDRVKQARQLADQMDAQIRKTK